MYRAAQGLFVGKMSKRKRRLERRCDTLERWLLRSHRFLIKVLLTCHHPPTLNLTNGWQFMCELLELGAVSGESNQTQIFFSQLKRRARQFVRTHSSLQHLWNLLLRDLSPRVGPLRHTIYIQLFSTHAALC